MQLRTLNMLEEMQTEAGKHLQMDVIQFIQIYSGWKNLNRCIQL